MKLTVDVKLVKNGFIVVVGKRSHPVVYPLSVWQVMPPLLRLPYAQFIAFISTVHLAFRARNKVVYLFPAPLGEPLFYYGLFLSMPENLLDFENSLKTSDYLKFVFNSFFKIEFTGHSQSLPLMSYRPSKTALIPFTFGKDSLLTYALCQEVGIIPIPIFLIEQHNTYENTHRYRLIPQFTQEFGTTVTTFTVPLQEFKQRGGLWWGWDIFLTQYTFYLIPFLYYYRAGYFLWSNEFDRSIVQPDNEGFLLAPTFDQTPRWLQVLETGLRLFGSDAKVASLLEPLTELAVHHVLHHRYPNLAKYQTSCNHDTKSAAVRRWCGECVSCAEDYLMLKAIGSDPAVVDLRVNMMAKNKRNYFYIFKKKSRNLRRLSSFTFFRDEQLLSFYLAYLRGARGGIMDEFKKTYLPIAKIRLKSLVRRYMTAVDGLSTPEELSKYLQPLFRKELQTLRSQFVSV